MRDKLKVVAAPVLIIAVVAVFIAPVVNLEPTAMRAWRAAQMIALGMQAAATTALLLTIAVPSAAARPEFLREPFGRSADLIALDCVRLC